MAEERQIGIPEEPLDYSSDLITKPYELDGNKHYDNDQKHQVMNTEIKRTVVGDNWQIPTQFQERRTQIEQVGAGLQDVIDVDSFLAKEYIKWRTDPAGAAAGFATGAAIMSIPPLAVATGGGALLMAAEKSFPETFGALKPEQSKELTRSGLEDVWNKEIEKESQKLSKAREDLDSGKISELQFDAMQKNFDALVARRQTNLEKVDKFNDAVKALDGESYPNKKTADASVIAATRFLQMRELNYAIEMAQKGIDPESTGYKIANIAGSAAILAGTAVGANYLGRYGLANALKRITTDAETVGGATRLATIKPIRSRREAAKIGAGAVEATTAEMESAQYVWENIKDYIERTGDKTLSEFVPSDAHTFMGAAYGAIAGKIETMGGIESIAAGGMRRLGVGGFGRRVLSTGLEEGAEEGMQQFSEFLSRKIDGTTDKTFGEALGDTLNSAGWGVFMGIGFGTIGGVTYRNARKQGIKVLQEYGLSRDTAEKVFDNMIDQVSDSISPQNETVRDNVREKVATIYENADLDPVELDDTVEAITDLEMAFIAQDSAENGIDIADNPILQGEVNEIGWFREGIPEQVSDQVRTLNDEIAGLRQQLREETAKATKDYNKIDDLEAKIEQFYAKLPQEISDIVETDRAKVRQMLDEQMARARDLQDRRKVVRQVQQRALKALQREQESDVQKSLRRLQEQTRTEEQKARAEERKQWQEQRKLRKAIEKLRQDMVRRKSKLPVSQELFADADLVYQALRDSGFTDSQISTMAETDIINAVMPYGISPQILKQSDLAAENARLDDIYPAYDGETIEVDGKERTVYNSNGDRIAKSKEALTNFWRWFGDSKVVDEQGRPIVMYHGTYSTFDTFDKTAGHVTDSGFFGSGFYFTPIKSEAEYYGRIVMPVYLKIEKPFIVSTGGYYSGLYDNLFECGGQLLKDLGLLAENDLKDFNKYERLKKEFLKKAKVEKIYTYDAKHNEVQVWRASFEKNGRSYEANSYRPWEEIGYNEKEDTKENALNNAWGEYAHFNDLNFLIQDLSFTDYIRTNGLAEELSNIIKSRGYDGTIAGDEHIVFEPNQIKSVDNRGTYSAGTGNIYYQTNVDDGLTTTDSIWSVINTLRGLKDSSTERLLYDKQKDTWFLENADDATHVQMFVKAFNQGNYPEFNNEREAEQYFQENYLADDQNLLQFLAQKYDRPEDAKQAMEHTLGTDEYTHAYLRDNMVIYSRYETDLSETDFPVNSFDHYKVEYDENNNREIKLVKKATKGLTGLEPQTRVSGKGKDFRGFYAPELRLISLAQNADPTTLAHELAHDWMQQFFRHYRSGKASESFMKSWGAVEKALGITENDIMVPDKASEAFARAYEAWILNNKDWAKNIDIEDKDRDKMIEIFKRYQGYLTDVYEDLNNPYFLETWGETGKLKPELQAWFDKVTNPIDLIDAQVQTGKITPAQAQTKQITRTVNEVVQAVENEFTPEEKEEIAAVERMNDTSRYEVEGGNKNSLQNRLSGLARDIDANNIALKRYDTHRDMLEVAKAADDFVRTRRDEAMNIINGIEPEKEGLYASDLYTALERFAVENNDVDLALELTNSKVAKDLAKEWGQRIAGFRNFTGDGDFDVISQLKSLDNKFKKDYDEKGKERVNTAADEYVEELNKADDSQDIDAFLDSIKCQ